MRLLWHNLVDEYTAPLVSSQKANFPAANVRHIHLARAWRSVSPSGQYYTIDAGDGNTLTATCAAIIGRAPYSHNLTSGVTAKIQAHPTNTWTAPDLDQAFSWNAATMVVFFTSTAKRFWRFYLHDPTNPNGYIQIPRLFLGTYQQVTKAFQKDFPEEKLSSSRITISPTGQPYTDKGMVRRRYALQFPYWTNSAKQAIESIADSVGKATPILAVLDEDNPDKLPPVYALIESDQRYEHLHNYTWKGQIDFVEVF